MPCTVSSTSFTIYQPQKEHYLLFIELKAQSNLLVQGHTADKW